MLAMAIRRIDVSDGVHVGALLNQVSRELGYTAREVARICRIPESTYCRATDGEAPLDLWWLRHLPYRIWQLFLIRLTSELTKQWFSDVLPLRMAKAAWDGTERRAEKKEQAS